ncbi:MAG: GTPase HflX [Polyangiaceae bacterium]
MTSNDSARAARPKAILIGVHLPEVTEAEFTSSLDELSRLLTTLGYSVVGRLTQARPHIEVAAVLGEGKLKELARMTGGSGHTGTTAPKKTSKAREKWEAEEAEEEELTSDDGAEEHDGAPGEAEPKVDLVAVDHDITPSQLRNLERATGVQVLDRTGVIIEIFHRHAKSREARLQVEIARLTYTAPRLRESPGGKERQRGRGAGEAAVELDRRKIRDRIAELKEELAHISKEQGVRRSLRKDARRVALVGYTNAGKSSLMRALTGSEVLVEDKLFATLDTTVRALRGPKHSDGSPGTDVKPRVLVSDTVGFIKKLPHDLVASFKSTLDEALEATLLLHVVDGSDPNYREQYAVTRDVLREIGADQVPSRLIFNKRDAITNERAAELAREEPTAMFLSAHDEADIARLTAEILAFFESTYEEQEFLVPYAESQLVSLIHEEGRVLHTEYDEEGTRIRVRASKLTIERLREAGARAL